jgi:hypothetical protein
MANDMIPGNLTYPSDKVVRRQKYFSGRVDKDVCRPGHATGGGRPNTAQNFPAPHS